MHLPDAWGFIVFGNPTMEDKRSDSVPKDSSWPVRLAAMHVYYAQSAYFEEHKTYAATLDLLTDFVDTDITDPFDIMIDLNDDDGYLVTVSGSPDGTEATVTHDRLLRIGVEGKATTT